MRETNKIQFNKQLLTAALLLLFIPIFICISVPAIAEQPYFDGEAYEFDFDEYDYEGVIILDDPIYFMDLIEEDFSCTIPAGFDPDDFMDFDHEEDEYVTPESTLPDSAYPSQQPEFAKVPDPSDASIPLETTSPYKVKSQPLKKAPLLYDIPEEVLAADEKFAALMEEAEKYIGYPYVWGGSSPETSFDCSGFVSYALTHSGVFNIGRRGATGLYNICQTVTPEEARPGDLIFFEGTMGNDVDGITHVGIYVGSNMMIHCGNPIGYADLTKPFWQKHFHSYGRLPY